MSALTEEAQVVAAVLDHAADFVAEHGHVRIYKYEIPGSGACHIGAASAHQMGAIPVGIYAERLLREFRPDAAVLVGIAASVDSSTAALGDVPMASQVIDYNEIAVSRGVLSFRTQGFQVDPIMRQAVGALRVSADAYKAWRDDCSNLIQGVVSAVNLLRRRQIDVQVVAPPHIVVEVVAGGPFLLRDSDFRDSTTAPQRFLKLPAYDRINIETPVHPKLVAVEMESHGFMRAAHECGIRASVMKGISDDGDANKTELESQTGGFYRAYACSNAVLLVLHALRSMVRGKLVVLNDALPRSGASSRDDTSLNETQVSDSSCVRSRLSASSDRDDYGENHFRLSIASILLWVSKFVGFVILSTAWSCVGAVPLEVFWFAIVRERGLFGADALNALTPKEFWIAVVSLGVLCVIAVILTALIGIKMLKGRRLASVFGVLLLYALSVWTFVCSVYWPFSGLSQTTNLHVLGRSERTYYLSLALLIGVLSTLAAASLMVVRPEESKPKV